MNHSEVFLNPIRELDYPNRIKLNGKGEFRYKKDGEHLSAIWRNQLTGKWEIVVKYSILWQLGQCEKNKRK